MNSTRLTVAEKLRELEERLRHELRARGFDPAQDENIALPGPLAKLYMERETLREQLEALSEIDEQAVRTITLMKEVERIANQLNRAVSGEAWHGPAVLELLEGISAAQAAARPVAGAHSIWELALHIEAWLRACRQRLAGDRAQLTTNQDWPPVTNSDEVEWKKVAASIKQAHDELSAAILALEDARLDTPVLPGMSSVYVTLHGAIQHSLYHAGQIAVLKKATEGQTA